MTLGLWLRKVRVPYGTVLRKMFCRLCPFFLYIAVDRDLQIAVNYFIKILWVKTSHNEGAGTEIGSRQYF